MQSWMASLALVCFACGAEAGPLDGKRFIVEVSSSQHASCYDRYLLPPLTRALRRAGLRPATSAAADVVVNVVTDLDVGQWIGQGADRAWTYTLVVTVGISPETHVIPLDGTPAFGVGARLLTPDGDRYDELSCLIGLAARTAVAHYRPEGALLVDGSGCLRD